MYYILLKYDVKLNFKRTKSWKLMEIIMIKIYSIITC